MDGEHITVHVSAAQPEGGGYAALLLKAIARAQVWLGEGTQILRARNEVEDVDSDQWYLVLADTQVSPTGTTLGGNFVFRRHVA